MKYVALDLELEQHKSNSSTPDSLLDKESIIQVGFVIFELEPEFKVLESYCKCVNIKVPLSTFIKNLTHISDEDIAGGVTLAETYADLCNIVEKHSTSRIVRQWGGGDMECYKDELESLGAIDKWAFGRSGFNVKHLFQTFAQANAISWRGGLTRSMTKCGLKWQGGRKHNALADAHNTAYIFDYLYKQLKKGLL